MMGCDAAGDGVPKLFDALDGRAGRRMLQYDAQAGEGRMEFTQVG